MAFKGRKSATKNPPFFSHEFFIQNHADIFSCITLVIVVGVMVQVSFTPLFCPTVLRNLLPTAWLSLLCLKIGIACVRTVSMLTRSTQHLDRLLIHVKNQARYHLVRTVQHLLSGGLF